MNREGFRGLCQTLLFPNILSSGCQEGRQICSKKGFFLGPWKRRKTPNYYYLHPYLDYLLQLGEKQVVDKTNLASTTECPREIDSNISFGLRVQSTYSSSNITDIHQTKNQKKIHLEFSPLSVTCGVFILAKGGSSVPPPGSPPTSITFEKGNKFRFWRKKLGSETHSSCYLWFLK